MSARILLIDGYNLMHAAGLGQPDYKRGELLRCRTRLMALLLSKMSGAEVRAATLVFDARDPPPDRPAQVMFSGLKVLFANPGGDADVIIKQWLERHPSPRRVMLVSSDRELQRAARGCGAKFLGSDEFLDELERRRPVPRQTAGRSAADDEHAKPGGNLSDAQTAYWLKEFGDVPVIDDEPAPSPEPPPAVKTITPPAGQTPGVKSRPKRNARSPDDTKPTGSIDQHELEAWLKIFGDTPEGNTSSPDELRLSDLESWLKDFQKENGRR